MTVGMMGNAKIATVTGILRDLLTNELGTFANSRKAIWVEPPASPPMPNTAPGLCCIIGRYPEQQTAEVYQYRVTLTQYDTSAAGIAVLDTAIARVRRRFPVRREPIPPYTEEDYPRAVFRLQFHLSAYPQLFHS